MNLLHRKIRFDEKRSFDFYHLCYYMLRNEVKDNYQLLLLDFKKGKEKALRRFIIEAIGNLQFLDVDPYLVVLRALGSKELKVEPDVNVGLDRLGGSLAEVLDCSYYPNVITKTRPTGAIKHLSAAERKFALKGIYRLDPIFFNLDDRKLLIIDDVVTTGSTACAVIEGVLKHYPKAAITVFSLAWTPSPKQQEYMLQSRSTLHLLNEPLEAYGGRQPVNWVDEDFINGETDVSLFPVAGVAN